MKFIFIRKLLLPLFVYNFISSSIVFFVNCPAQETPFSFRDGTNKTEHSSILCRPSCLVAV